MSYYQKYRPQKIEELDLVDVRENLLGALKSGELAHAYLFVGPRGSGKTSAARILAQVVNCEKNIKSKVGVEAKKKNGGGRVKVAKGLGEPCGKCKVCKGIRLGSEVDILEMDAASHRGIDDIRSLKERIKLAPVSLSKKVYIIDEVHMLTREAFNALLKVLEEPPRHVMFFLCTTELHKVPETIISRCAKVSFTKATVDEVGRSLGKVVKGEKLKIDKKALMLLAESVDGSFREGHKLLQQLGAGNKQISLEDVTKILKLAGGETVTKLLYASLEKRPEEIGSILGEAESKGVDAGNLLENLLKSLQDMIRVKIEAGGETNLMVQLAGLLIGSAEKIKVSPLPFLPIELALLEVALGESGSGGSSGLKKQAKKVVRRADKVAEKNSEKDNLLETLESDLSSSEVVADNTLSMAKIEEDWGKLLDKLSERNRSVAGLLRASKPKMANGNNLTVEVFYEFHKNQLEQDSKRVLVEQVAKELWGPTILRCVLGERQRQKPVKAEDRVIKTVREDEYVKSAEDVFGS